MTETRDGLSTMEINDTPNMCNCNSYIVCTLFTALHSLNIADAHVSKYSDCYLFCNFTILHLFVFHPTKQPTSKCFFFTVYNIFER